VAGIIGAILTGAFNAQILGGPGLASAAEIFPQLWIQVEGVLITIVWTGVVSWVAYFIADKLCGLRVSNEEEREGLDISTHGETAYQR
jgi:Amt family ammonium transporter